MFQAAVVQLTSTSRQDENLEEAARLIREAAGRGARLIATPENTNFLGPHEAKVERAETLEGPTCTLFSELARETASYLLLGSFNERSPDPRRCFNTSVLFAPDGEILAHYRKIHLFDVDVASDVRFEESATVVAGDRVAVVATPLAQLGLSICYDLRFPELYQELVEGGAEMLAVPSAFTARTGKDHWHPLLRARAIETQCFVLAPAQSGVHDDNGYRETYGHSLIVDPWGQILASVAEGPGLAVADIDLGRLERIRRSMPVQQHRRLRDRPLT